MGNQPSSSSRRESSSSSSRHRRNSRAAAEQAAERAKQVVGDIQEGFKNSVKKLDDDHPAAQLLDQMCGTYFDDDGGRYRYRHSRSASYYSDEGSEDGSRTYRSEDDTTYDGRRSDRHRKSDKSVDSASYTTYSEYESEPSRRDRKSSGRDSNHHSSTKGKESFDTEEESKATATQEEPKLISKPLASSFAKRCYFTKAGIGKTTQHYEGLTLTGNVVLMLAAAMKLKGCPTICDEDLRRVEQTYPNQFSRLPDELLLSSGWRRISKYCHFSNKPIPDGVPFFHSKQRLHPSGGYYFLLAAAVGMIRPIDVEPITKDTLVLLETDFPTQCDATPSVLVRDPEHWVLVNKFCFFSGGPINAEEDVYYQADFDGNAIYMLAFLSPSLTPEELYKLAEVGPNNEPGLKSVAEVSEIESVYDLTDRDFDDLKLYHLGPCRALPQYILQPSAWTKVLPPHFLAARQQAMLRAQDFEGRTSDGTAAAIPPATEQYVAPPSVPQKPVPFNPDHKENGFADNVGESRPHDESYLSAMEGLHREMNDEGLQQSAQSDNFPVGRAPSLQEDINSDPRMTSFGRESVGSMKMDPPEDEPPSLKKDNFEEVGLAEPRFADPGDFIPSPAVGDSVIDDQGFFSVAGTPVEKQGEAAPYSNTYVSPESTSASNRDFFHEGSGQPNSAEPFKPNNQFAESQYTEDEMVFDEFADGAHGERPTVNMQHHVESPFTGASTNRFFDAESTMNDQAQQIHDVNNEPSDEFDPKIPTQQAVERPLDPLDPYDGKEEKKSAMERTQYNSHYGTPERYYAEKRAIGTTQSVGLDAPPSFESKSHQSPAMMGAHEVLKRNRRRRLEVLASGNRASPTKQTPKTPSEASAGTFEDSGSEFTGSAVSGSDVWSEASGAGDKSNRRALILQMAKARMKNNKDRDASNDTTAMPQAPASPIMETHETSSLSRGPDIDLTGDLD